MHSFTDVNGAQGKQLRMITFVCVLGVKKGVNEAILNLKFAHLNWCLSGYTPPTQRRSSTSLNDDVLCQVTGLTPPIAIHFFKTRVGPKFMI